jgi:hypothetical protein
MSVSDTAAQAAIGAAGQRLRRDSTAWRCGVSTEIVMRSAQQPCR